MTLKQYMITKDTLLGLMLRPERLHLEQGVMELIVLKRVNDRDIPKELFPIHERIITHLPRALQGQLLALSNDALAAHRNNFYAAYSKQKKGQILEQAVTRAMFRHMHEKWIALLQTPLADRCYLQTQLAANGKTATTRCYVHANSPTLRFELMKSEQGGLAVSPFFTLPEQPEQPLYLRQDAFFIRNQQQGWIMAYEDFLKVSWLEAQRPEQYAYKPILLLERIVARLEETHPVDRKHFFPIQDVRCTPVPRLFLSELGDAFLLLTPRFNYEGIEVDGPWRQQQEVNRNGRMFRVHRDQDAEQTFVRQLHDLHPAFQKQLNGLFSVPFAEAKRKQWFLHAYHALLDQGVEIVGLDMMKHFRYSAFLPDVSLLLERVEPPRLFLRVAVRFGKQLAPLAALQQMLFAAQNTLLLNDQSIAVFPQPWLSQYDQLFRHAEILEDDLLVIPQWLLLTIPGLDQMPVFRPVFSQAWWARWQHWQQSDAPAFEVPSTLVATLRDYQRKGFEWLVLLAEIGAGACLADEMGLGKTIQTVAFLEWRRIHRPKSKSLVVCPASLTYNWQQALKQFLPHLGVYKYTQPGRLLQAFLDDENATCLITTYGTLRSDLQALSACTWDTIILDESQNIKNLAALATQAALRLNAAARVALSGTPIMNHTFDLYAQMEFLIPGLLGSQAFFRREYANPIDREGDADKVKALRQLTAPFVLRRTKQQVAADLPEKTEYILWCDFGETQRAIYESVKSSIRSSIFLDIQNQGLAKAKLSILQGILRLRQACCAPQLLPEWDKQPTESIKIDRLMHELTENLAANKALVFSQFKEMLYLIAEACRLQGIPFFHFDGDTPPQQRQQLVEQFQNEACPVRVFLISLKAGNSGLTLTAADYVFLIDPWWNTAIQQQAIDRTHRIGQQKRIFAYKMICRNTIEERILTMQQRKQALTDELVQADEGFVKNLTEADIAFLFE